MKRFVLIVAAGSGTRMGSALAKQFMLLAGRPLLMHTIRRFHDADQSARLVVVLPPSEKMFWQGLCHQHKFNIQHEVVGGGATRFQSVKNGLELVPHDCMVAVHDGVRPFVTKSLILHSFKEAESHGNAIPAISVHESLRKISSEMNERVDRKEYQIIQTPQCFQAALLKKAYADASAEEFTDDASVAEASGVKIHLVHGLRENIKITTQADYHMAEGLIKYFED